MWAVELRGITKRFGAVAANAGVNLRVAAGTIHGVVGENGAGKSTAMKILYGLYRPDAGELWVNGRRCMWNSPADAIARGIGMVHQHFMLAGPYSALDNILLGAEPGRRAFLDRGSARARLDKLARQYGLAVDSERPVEEMSVGLQQRIEILKLLYRDAGILILDEPTAVLTPQESTALFENLKKLKAQGNTILLVTHKLQEVLAHTERVTVFRAGLVTGERVTAETNPEELAELMVGRKVVLRLNVPPAASRGDIGLEVVGLHLSGVAGSRPKLLDVSFKVRRGEIMGIAGVEGNGQTELVQALLHPREATCRSSGRVKVLGQEATTWRADKIRQAGVGLIPEDRLREGLLLERPLLENFLLGRTREFSRGGFLDWASARQAAGRALADYDVRPPELAAPAGSLSGGNQQKLVVARELQRQPAVLIAAQPTRGVDVGAIEAIHQRIVRARDSGAAVLLISSDLDELLALSDRILVMFEGRTKAEFHRGDVTERELGLEMGGA